MNSRIQAVIKVIIGKCWIWKKFSGKNSLTAHYFPRDKSDFSVTICILKIIEYNAVGWYGWE